MENEDSVVEGHVGGAGLAADLTLGQSGAPAAVEEIKPRLPQLVRGKIDKNGVAMGTGRRKTAIARVRLKDGTGVITINGRPLAEYCVGERDRNSVLAPLKATDLIGKVDISVLAHGGGPTGQAEAMMLGIARALQAKNPLLHGALADGGYLTRDSRMVERKMYGHKKSRRSFQFSKR
jgi:small subunit ribosomal protein S9